MTSYYGLLNKIEAFCNAHLQVKKFAGEFKEQMPNFCTLDERYPVVFVVPSSNLPTLNQNEFTVDIYCVDVIQKDRQNLNVILSDTQLILNDLYLYFTDGPDFDVEITSSPTLNPVNNFDLDYVAGWVMSATFAVNGYCVEGIPMTPIIPGIVECEPAIVRNSDDSYNVTVSSGNTHTLPDVTIKVFDQDGNLLSGEVYPSVQPQDITVTCPTCPDPIINIKKEGDGTIDSLTLGCGTTTDYYIADSHISVNGVEEFQMDATDPLDIIIITQNSQTINPSSIVFNGNQHHVHLTVDTTVFGPCGNTLQKTGQTISYRTGDDGDLEAGRNASFTVLPKNNPFGNTIRFTDVNGNQSYNNDIVIDWSTFNDSTVLGWYRLPQSSTDWNTAVDNGIAFSVGPYNSGWRLANIQEYMSICNFGKTTSLSYPPLNISNAAYFHTSTTYAQGTTNAMKFYYTGQFFADPKANNALSLFCRTFTVNGTNLS